MLAKGRGWRKVTCTAFSRKIGLKRWERSYRGTTLLWQHHRNVASVVITVNTVLQVMSCGLNAQNKWFIYFFLLLLMGVKNVTFFVLNFILLLFIGGWNYVCWISCDITDTGVAWRLHLCGFSNNGLYHGDSRLMRRPNYSSVLSFLSITTCHPDINVPSRMLPGRPLVLFLVCTSISSDSADSFLGGGGLFLANFQKIRCASRWTPGEFVFLNSSLRCRFGQSPTIHFVCFSKFKFYPVSLVNILSMTLVRQMTV